MTDENETFEQLPDALVDQLKSADRPGALITSRVDRELLQLAEKQFASRGGAWLRRPAWAAVAATALITFFVVQFNEPVMQETTIVENDAIYRDVDDSGQIDIADVLALARSRDIDDETQAELDAFAMRVVSLSLPEESS